MGKEFIIIFYSSKEMDILKYVLWKIPGIMNTDQLVQNEHIFV